MHALIEKLTRSRVVLTDGAWGTELQSRGLPAGQFPDAWNLSHPERVGQVARAYVDAGSQIILTNTFGANRARLAGHGFADEIKHINRAGVEISLQAAEGQALVFASIGPSGRMLLTGDVTADELRAAFTEQAEALAAAGANGIVIETTSDIEEAVIAIHAARSTTLPVVACMVFDSGRDKDRTMMGNTPEQVADALIDAGADVIGANCGQGIEGYPKICQRLRAAAKSTPLWIKPNAGFPEMIEEHAVYRVTPESFASHAAALITAGASFLGGCCGTSPLVIEALAKEIRQNHLIA